MGVHFFGFKDCLSVLLATLAAATVILQPQEALADITGVTRVATGLNSPMFVTHAPGDPNRLFIAERGTPFDSTNASASIRVLDLNTGVLQATPYLTIPGVNNTGEGGLLGLAFHPDFQTNGKFYVYITASDSTPNTHFTSHIREYTAVSPASPTANPSFNPILQWGQPQSNHNGGWIGFSPNDNFLYIMSGDGGGTDDNDAGHTAGIGNAQDITNNLLGKVLRIDVNGDDFTGGDDPSNIRNYAIPATNPFKDAVDGMGMPVVVPGDDEIWALGLRNPFRASFDRVTGDLWIGDVGQSAREEIDFQAADSAGGLNYGWREREGLISTPSGGVGGPKEPDHVDPVYDYNRDNDPFGGTVVTGGYVYRGPDPTLQGKYFFLDSRSSPNTADDNYWSFEPANPFGTVANIDSMLTPNIGSPQFPVSFGEDAHGNLYIAYLSTGDVYRIATDEFTPGDFNGDASVDDEDVAIWTTGFGTLSAAARTDGDADGDADVDGADFLAWQRNLGWSPANAGTAASGAAIPEPRAFALLALATIAVASKRAGRPK
ncbi:MAG TPA: PQQ-dependent sugar dehydrogenase [Lacipirellula sp.]